MEFKVGDKITAFQGGQTYKAKVLGVRKSNGEVELKVHYQGWKARWDEWIGLDRAGRDGHPPPAQVRADEEAARKAAEDAKEEEAAVAEPATKKRRGAGGSVKGRRGSSRASDAGSVGHGSTTRSRRSPVAASAGDGTSLPLAAPLKQALVDDWQRITQQSKVVSLPCAVTVTAILSNFIDAKRAEILPNEEQGSPTASKEARDDMRVWEEVVAGVQLYFDKSLASHLLYRTEKANHEAKFGADSGSGTPPKPSDVYGGVHLLRLFVKFPELLARTALSGDEQKALMTKLKAILGFLRAHSEKCIGGIKYVRDRARSKYST